MNKLIIESALEADCRLEELGLSLDELKTVAFKAIAAKNQSVAIDPVNASGLLSYIYGTRATRELLLPKGDWKINREENIESTYNSKLNIKIIFQNVDSACGIVPPKANSGKGNGSKRLIDASRTHQIFPEDEKLFELQRNTSVWYLCVSSEGDQIRAELSMPISIENDQFSEFSERIFIITNENLDPIEYNADDSSTEFEIEISRK